jgi:hypothetical protein
LSSIEPGALGRVIAATLEEVTLSKVRDVGLANARMNAERIRTGEDILALQRTRLMEGDTALVMGAGPSLHRTNVAGRLKASGFQGPIVATESAMAYCFRNGLVPDLIVTLDPHPERIVRLFGDPALTSERLAKDDYFRRQDLDPAFAEDELRFNRELYELVNAHGPRVFAAVASSASQAVVDRVYESGMMPYWWNPFYDDYDQPDSLTRRIYEMNGLPCVNAGGNVGTAAWVFAHAVLQKRRVGLVGIDLSYYADTPYQNTQYYYELRDLVGADRLDEVFVRIHNPYVNADFYTDPTYLWYRDVFLQMAQTADCETVNCTEGGILFGEGVRFESLDRFLAGDPKH